MLKSIAKNILLSYLNTQLLKKEIKKAFTKRYKKAPITVRENRIKVPLMYIDLAERLRMVNGNIFKRLVRESLNELGIKIGKSNDAYYWTGVKKRRVSNDDHLKFD